MALELVQTTVETCRLQDLKRFQSFVFADKEASQTRFMLVSVYPNADMLMACMCGSGTLYHINGNTKVVPGPMCKGITFPV